MNRSATLLLTQRLMSSCSTPHSSGNSDRIPFPPSAATRSAACPIAGFAEILENPSEPPHLSPRQSCDRGSGPPSLLSASPKPFHASPLPPPTLPPSHPLFSSSNTT